MKEQIRVRERCPDCRFCQMCSRSRCRLCRKGGCKEGPREPGIGFTYGEYLEWKRKRSL